MPVANRAEPVVDSTQVVWAVVSAEIGQTIEIFPRREQAEEMLARVLADEPDWHDDRSIESLKLVTGSQN
jgi:hypothetical protein